MATQGKSENKGKRARLLLVLNEPGGRNRLRLNNVDLNMSLKAFQILVEERMGIPSEMQGLEMMKQSSGLRPKFAPLDMAAGSGKSLFEHGIHSGHSLVVKDLRNEHKTATVRQGKGWEYPPTVPQGGRMVRQNMPRDNSCLFHSIAYITDQAGEDRDASALTMRTLAAQIIGNDPTTYDSVFLGMPNSRYIQVVMDPSQWGGGIELQLFSRHFEIEICAFDYHFLREDHFGQGEGFKKRAFLIYTGEHYDVLVHTDNNGNPRKLFSPKDDSVWKRARDMIHGLHTDAVKAGKCKLQKEWRRKIRNTKTSKSYTGGSARLGFSGSMSPQNTDCPSANTRVKRMSIVSNTTLKPSQAIKEAVGIVNQRGRDSKSSGSSSGALTASSQTEPRGSPGAKEPVQETKKKKPPVRDDKWSCTSCTYENTILPDKCQVCRTPNPNYRPDPALFPGLVAGENGGDSNAPQRLIYPGNIAPAAGLSTIDPTLVQQLQLHSIPAWICPQCRVLNPRGTIQCALGDCLCPNPIIGVTPQMMRQQQLRRQQQQQGGNEGTSDGCILS